MGLTITAAAALMLLTGCSGSSPKPSAPDPATTPAQGTVTHTASVISATTAPPPTPATVSTTEHVTATEHATASSTPRTGATAASSTSTGASGGNANTNGTASPCLSAHLDLASEGRGGAGGTDYRRYSLTNTGSDTCTLRGYAGVSIVDSAGKTVQHPAQRGRTGTAKAAPVTVVSVKPHGGKAYFLVTSINVIPSSPDCQHAFHGYRLRVYPPNNTAPLYLTDTGNFCDLGVGAVTAARNG